MTNTRITDPEILENRFPHVRLEAFFLARQTGGQGRCKGGDGMTVTLLTERRQHPPFGLAGGENGQMGENTWLHANGKWEKVAGRCQIQILAGDGIRIQTPGGGGFGK